MTIKEEDLTPETVLETDLIRGVKNTSKESVLYSVPSLRTRLNAEIQAFLKAVTMADDLTVDGIGFIGGVLLDGGLINGNKKTDIYSHEFTTDETWAAVAGLDPDTIIKTDVDGRNIVSGSVSVEYDSVSLGTVTVGEIKTFIDKAEAVDIIASPGVFDISSAIYSSLFKSVATEEDRPQGVAFKPDGTKMYIVGLTNDTVYQYTLSTPWKIDTASYDTVLFAAGTNPTDVTFKPDGIKMYVTDTSGNVREFTLSTAWLVSSASAGPTFSHLSIDNAQHGLRFKSDGTKFYTCGAEFDRFYQYSLGTPWDMSTASYDSIFFSISGQDTDSEGIEFAQDGSKLIMVGAATNTAYQYTLSTPWDLSTIAYDSLSFSLAGQDTDITGIAIEDFTKMYIVGDINNSIFQYSIPDAVFDNNAFAVVQR